MSDAKRVWAEKRFNRLDSDRVGYLTDKEMHSGRFFDIIKETLDIPRPTHAVMSRAGLTDWIKKALHKDEEKGVVTFDDFMELCEVLRHISELPKVEAEFIFGLFDCNRDGFISREEFKEIYRFFAQTAPPNETLHQIWKELKPDDGSIDSKKYFEWLKKSRRQEYYGKQQSLDSTFPGFSTKRREAAAANTHDTILTVFDMYKMIQREWKTQKHVVKYSWSPNHHQSDSVINEGLHPNMRSYFGRPRSEYCTPEGRSRLLGLSAKRVHATDDDDTVSLSLAPYAPLHKKIWSVRSHINGWNVDNDGRVIKPN